MSRPIAVQIVRPTSGPLVDLISAVVTFALRSWTVMLLLGALLPQAHVGFGKAVLIILLVGALNPPNFQYWSKAGTKK